MILICIKGGSKDGRAAGAFILSVTTIFTGETAMVDTEPSRNRSLHAAPAANGRLVAGDPQTPVPPNNWVSGGAAAVEDNESDEAAHKVLRSADKGKVAM
jgi:hypothetical protein